MEASADDAPLPRPGCHGGAAQPDVERTRGAAVSDVAVKIISLEADDDNRIGEVCSLLVRSFRALSPEWVATHDRAREVVLDAREHPLGFWLAVGFTVVGVFPDAEGIGKPTILMARPIGRRG